MLKSLRVPDTILVSFLSHEAILIQNGPSQEGHNQLVSKSISEQETEKLILGWLDQNIRMQMDSRGQLFPLTISKGGLLTDGRLDFFPASSIRTV